MGDHPHRWTDAARELPDVPLDVRTVGTDVVLDATDWCGLYGVDADGAATR